MSLACVPGRGSSLQGNIFFIGGNILNIAYSLFAFPLFDAIHSGPGLRRRQAGTSQLGNNISCILFKLIFALQPRRGHGG